MSIPNIISIESKQAIKTSLRFIKSGGLISVPTDTVYGIVCDAFNPAAIEKIYFIKGRNFSKPLPVLIGNLAQLEIIVPPLNAFALKLVKEFWPGPLTVIVPRLPSVPSQLSTNPTIGIRMPDHGWLLKLLSASGPLASTSANLSGNPEARSAFEVLGQFGKKMDLIIDGGPSSQQNPSTVVDCSSHDINILREGPISSDSILAVLS